MYISRDIGSYQSSMINTFMLNPNHQIYLSFSSLFLYHNNQKMFYKKGEKCNAEGCCTPSKRYCAPESPFLQQSQEDKPDAKYPRLWQEVYHAIYYLPYSLLIFFHDLYSHSILRKPKRPTWGITTTFTIAVVHVIRCIFQENSLSLWRASLRLPSKLSKSMDKYHSAPFVAKRLNLPGILKNFDAREDGTREIEAHWLFPSAITEEEEHGNEGQPPQESKRRLYYIFMVDDIVPRIGLLI